MSDTPDTDGTAAGTPDAGETPASTPKAPLRLLRKDSFLKRADVRYEWIPVPEWEEDGQIPEVRIRSLTGAEWEEFEMAVSKTGADGVTKTDMRNARAKLLVKVVVDENGGLVFDASDVGQLAQKNAGALSRLFDAASKLSGVMKREDAVKN